MIKNGKIKIGDFKVTQRKSAGGDTRFGSLKYRSPEIVNMLTVLEAKSDKEFCTSAADIW